MADVRVDIENHIAVVTMDNPPVNAGSAALQRGLVEAFESFTDNRDVRVAVLTGAGRAFCGGADLKAKEETPDEMAARKLLDRGRAWREAFWAIYDSAVPVIGAINGPGIGAGLAIASVCDVLVAADNAWLAAAEINVGLLGAFSQLSLLVGSRYKAREYFFSGRPISAQELHAMGAVSKVVPGDQLMDAAMELAREFASKSPIAIRLAKESMNRVEFQPLKDAYRTEQDYTFRLLTFDDSREANRAWREKRDPDWKWR